SFCRIDPEGDYQALTDLQGVVVLGGRSHTALPKADDLKQLVRRLKSGLVLDLSAMTRAEKVAYATQALGTVAISRSASGLPHWLIIDEAHHLFPTEGSSAAELLGPGTEPVCRITPESPDP